MTRNEHGLSTALDGVRCATCVWAQWRDPGNENLVCWVGEKPLAVGPDSMCGQWLDAEGRTAQHAVCANAESHRNREYLREVLPDPPPLLSGWQWVRNEHLVRLYRGHTERGAIDTKAAAGLDVCKVAHDFAASVGALADEVDP